MNAIQVTVILGLIDAHIDLSKLSDDKFGSIDALNELGKELARKEAMSCVVHLDDDTTKEFICPSCGVVGITIKTRNHGRCHGVIRDSEHCRRWRCGIRQCQQRRWSRRQICVHGLRMGSSNRNPCRRAVRLPRQLTPTRRSHARYSPYSFLQP